MPIITHYFVFLMLFVAFGSELFYIFAEKTLNL
jgi:NADH:ubiquinone oxidoreductase subunit 3 (subunit A)